MKKVKLSTLFLLILTAAIFITINKNFAQTKDISERNSLSSPEIAVSEFWKAIYNNNEEKLIEIAPVSDINIFEKCPEKEITSDIEFVKYDGNKQKTYNDDPTLPFSSKELSDNTRIFARYIYATKIKWNRFKIINEKTYNDEALLTVQIADINNNFSKGEKFAFALKRTDEEWKLVRVVQLGVFSFVDENIEYASPQVCN